MSVEWDDERALRALDRIERGIAMEYLSTGRVTLTLDEATDVLYALRRGRAEHTARLEAEADRDATRWTRAQINGMLDYLMTHMSFDALTSAEVVAEFRLLIDAHEPDGSPRGGYGTHDECVHGALPSWCVHCLRADNSEKASAVSFMLDRAHRAEAERDALAEKVKRIRGELRYGFDYARAFLLVERIAAILSSDDD